MHPYENGVCTECGQSFDITGLYTITFPDTVERISARTFRGVPVQAVVLPDSLESIGSKAFANCTELRYVFIPAALRNALPYDAFEGCTQLEIIFR